MAAETETTTQGTISKPLSHTVIPVSAAPSRGGGSGVAEDHPSREGLLRSSTDVIPVNGLNRSFVLKCIADFETRPARPTSRHPDGAVLHFWASRDQCGEADRGHLDGPRVRSCPMAWQARDTKGYFRPCLAAPALLASLAAARPLCELKGEGREKECNTQLRFA